MIDVATCSLTSKYTTFAKWNIDHIFIAPPNASEQTLREIAKSGSGYLYLLGRAGVTGAEIKANFSLDETLSVLNQYHSAPSLVGFGISEPAQVKHFVSKGAGGAIGGSATVAIVERFLQEPKTMHKNLADFCSAMKAATHPD
ncbi:MAG: tryptophan synthase subunit alpha [Exilibacterium sp.]